MSGPSRDLRDRDREKESIDFARLSRRPTFSHSDVVQYRTLSVVIIFGVGMPF